MNQIHSEKLETFYNNEQNIAAILIVFFISCSMKLKSAYE